MPKALSPGFGERTEWVVWVQREEMRRGGVEPEAEKSRGSWGHPENKHPGEYNLARRDIRAHFHGVW